MTDEPVPATPLAPQPHEPALDASDPSHGRVRVDGPAPARKFDALPALYLLGFLVLAGALAYLYRHPALPEGSVRDAGRVDTLQRQIQALTDRLGRVESRPAPVIPAAVPAPNLAPIETRIAALENRPAPAIPTPPPPVDLGPLQTRLTAVEQRPAPPQVDLGPLTTRLDALAAKQAADIAALSGKFDAADSRATSAGQALAARLAAVEAQSKQTAGALDAIAQRAQRAGRLQAAVTALNAGQKLGDIPGAPPAIARFATETPPTEAALRLSFDAAATAAARASQPAIMDDQPFASRLWTRAQQAVTVRQGDRVLLGDPVAGVLTEARQALDAGDLQGAVTALDGLAGPAAAAMASWTGQARALLAARAALAGMAAS